jgi:hypothetical protein
MNEYYFFVAAFLVAAFGGLASLMRQEKALKFSKCTSAMLNSGLLGLGVSFVWYTQFKENVYTLLGICIMLGLGGNSAIDFVLNAVRKGGFTIKLGSNGDLTTKPANQDDGEKKDAA